MVKAPKGTVFNSEKTQTCYSPEEVNSAMVTVMTARISESFVLRPEEAMWLHMHIEQILSPYASTNYKSIPAGAKVELETKEFTAKLNTIIQFDQSKKSAQDTLALQASLQDWAQVIAEPVLEMYGANMRTMDRISLTARFAGVLSELGIGDSENPRKSIEVPTDVKTALRAAR